jgi:predicted nucleic-acid-binding Zn-ribbon protein
VKTTGVCPKCGSTDLRIDRRPTWANMIPAGRSVFRAVYTSKFICASCGYVEMWIEREKDLAKIQKKLSAP